MAQVTCRNDIFLYESVTSKLVKVFTRINGGVQRSTDLTAELHTFLSQADVAGCVVVHCHAIGV